MAVYLKEFSTHSEYEQYINGSGAILPNVSICTTEGDVHYNPSSPTPQSCITAITIYDEESFETPFCSYGSPTLYFSRPVSFNELQNLEIEVCFCWEHEEGKEPIRLTPYVGEDYIEFRDESWQYYMVVNKPEESAINSIDLNIDDNEYWFNRIYLQ